MRIRTIASACFISAVFTLAACGSGQPSSSSRSATVQNTSSGSVTGTGHYHAKLALDGQPEMRADGKNIVVNVSVTNDGSGTFGSTTEPNNVNLGAHAIDASGKVAVNDLARGHLPQIAPGSTEKASILLPVSETLGRSVWLLPVQENVGWFDTWGTKALVVGPFQRCKAQTSKVCDASDKPLPISSAQP